MKINELIHELEVIRDIYGDLELVGETPDEKYLSGCVEYRGNEMKVKLTFSDTQNQCYVEEKQ